MRIILDTNIIISALLKDGTTRLILNSNDFSFLAPEYTIKEINKHFKLLIKKTKLKEREFKTLLNLIISNIHFIQINKQKLKQAKQIMKKIDINDAPILACALTIPNGGLWTEDKHFEKQNKIIIWKTKDLIKLI